MNNFENQAKDYLGKIDQRKKDALINELKKTVSPGMLKDIAMAASSGNMEEAKKNAQKLLEGQNGKDLAKMLSSILGE